MANGKVITGFSKPYAAIYNNADGVVTYSGAQPLGRGVNVNLAPESSDDNKFYADNVAAESASGVFTGGTITLTIDGFLTETRRKFFGLPEADADGWIADGDSASAPYVGIGYLVRYMEDGITTYVPTVVAKSKLGLPAEAANTQEAEIDWQTTEISGSLMRDDTSNHNWRFIGKEYSTEEDAEAALVAKLGGVVAMPHVAAMAGTEEPFGTPVTDIQENVVVNAGNITGTLKTLTSGALVDTWGEGHFLAIQLSDISATATSVKIGMTPSEGSGLVELLDDPDKNGVFKVTNKDTQKFTVQMTDKGVTTTKYYGLSGLTLE